MVGTDAAPQQVGGGPMPFRPPGARAEQSESRTQTFRFRFVPEPADVERRVRVGLELGLPRLVTFFGFAERFADFLWR